MRYAVAHKGNDMFVISNTNNKILLALERYGRMDYKSLSKYTKAPTQSLYVFVGRLKGAGLVKVKTTKKHGTLVSLNTRVDIYNAKAVG